MRHGRTRPRRPRRRRLGWRLAGLLAAAAAPGTARAQLVGAYLPSAPSGYQQEPGVTVASRLRPLYQPLGVRIGDFILHGDLAEGLGYNSDVSGLGGAPGSWFGRTTGALSLNSDWSRDRLGVAVSVDDARFLSAPRQDFTDWTASLGGALTLGREDLSLTYTHLSLHEDPTAIGSVLSSTPIPYQVEDLRAGYTFDRGRVSLSPRVDVQLYRFGDATLLGVPVSQANENRVVLNAGLETGYALTDRSRVVFVVEGIASRYTDQPEGVPSDSSRSALVLGGVDYEKDGLWRYRVLLGVETRDFDAPQYRSHSAPVVEANVVWTPTGMTTVSGTLTRAIEDPAAAGTGGYTLTRGRLVVDHEWWRNVLLQAHLGFETADYLQGGGTQRNVSAGAGIHWLLDRRLRLALDYSFLAQSGASNVNLNVPPARAGAFGTLRSSDFDRSVLLLTLRFAL